MALSKQQTKIINCDLNTDVLVNAAAGSGKTFVLKNKIATHLAKGEIEPSQLLVLTFTNNAAHDMKVQIIEEVNKIEPKDAKDKERINEIKNAIYSAHIQTFDSFAQEIVKSYAYMLGIPNTTMIANEFVLEAKKIQLLNQIIDKKYITNDKDFIDLVSSYNLRDDKKTKAVILDMYQKFQKYTPTQQKALIDKFLNLQDKKFFDACYKEYEQLFAQQLTIKAANLRPGKKQDDAYAAIPAKVAEEMGDKEQERELYLSTFRHIKTLFSIYEELEEALKAYKRQSNTYTFNDIAIMSLQILHNEEIAEVIRSNFKYIMIDEYQDTNDIQQEVIDILLKPKKDGTRNHLFAVGDPKQSIYGFRNANLNIFRNKEKEFKKSKDAKVIHMNQTFRSHPDVIDDVNAIFDKYMTLDHGGIDYSEDGQQLELAESITDRKWSGYGLNIITTKEEKDLTDDKASKLKLWEVRAIIQDIKKKVNNKLQVFDKKTGKQRNINYGDFYILVRTKANYALYEREFAAAGIALNNKISTNLVEVNAIMLIASFIKAFALFDSGKKDLATIEQQKHIFASIARSYIARDFYNDQEIIKLIQTDEFMKTELWNMILLQYKFSKVAPFSVMLLGLINMTGIMPMIHKIGEVGHNAAKIESLIQLVKSIEDSGGQIKDFSELLDIISKNYIDLKDESVVDLEEAVSLMTIHQAKGLQNKIVYLPNSVNHLGGMTYMNKPDYDFDENFGILLPIYDFSNYRNIPDNAEEYPNGGTIFTIPYKLFRIKRKENQEEIDEHVRLFYVALTRAEQGIYIVGYPKCTKKLVDEGKEAYFVTNKTKETLFHMLSYVYPMMNLFPFSGEYFPKNKWEFVSLAQYANTYRKPLAITHIDDRHIHFDKYLKVTASQLKQNRDDEVFDFIEKGIELHDIMESVDLSNPNLDFITDPAIKAKIQKVLNMDIFKKTLKGATFYPEYEYYDPKIHTLGYIDLLAIKNDTYYIIDYKLFNIDKKEYTTQLNIYKDNVSRIFNVAKDKIKIMLVSLEKQTIKEIE